MQVPFYNSLRFKIGFGYLVLIVINVGVMLWTIYNFARLTDALSDFLTQSYPTVIAVENMARSVERHDKAVRSFINGDLNNGKIELEIAKEEFYQCFDQCRAQISNELNEAILDDIYSTHEGYLLLIDSLQNYVNENKMLTARSFHYDRILPFYRRLADNCFWLIEENQKTMLIMSGRTKEIASDSVIAIISASFIAIVLSVVIIIQFSKRIILPAERLAKTVRQIGRGQLDLKIDVQTTDEFGLLSREFNKMTERLRRFEAMNIDTILLEKKKSETIVESLTDAIIVCSSNGTILHFNEGAERLFGLHRTLMVGKPIADSTNDAVISSVFKELERSPYIKQPFIEFTQNGKITYLHPKISPIFSRYNEREGTVVVLQDVSEFKELDKMKSDFMATVSHEFRTPVTSMSMGVDILRQRMLGPLTPQQEELLESFKEDCSRLTKLVRDLLQLSKLESGKTQQRDEMIDFRSLIHSTVHQVEIQFKGKGVTLETDIPDSLPAFRGDYQQLSWVLLNLMNNAHQYTPQGGIVKIHAEATTTEITVSVSDSGKGIPPEFIGKIFDKFVQVKHPNDPTPGSVGLGLSIAKDIVELYGGTIRVESQVDKGSTFTFQLPIQRGTSA